MSSKSVSQIFNVSFQTGDINNFVVVSFLVDMLYNRYVQLKAPFLTKTTSLVKSETHFSRETIEN